MALLNYATYLVHMWWRIPSVCEILSKLLGEIICKNIQRNAWQIAQWNALWNTQKITLWYTLWFTQNNTLQITVWLKFAVWANFLSGDLFYLNIAVRPPSRLVAISAWTQFVVWVKFAAWSQIRCVDQMIFLHLNIDGAVFHHHSLYSIHGLNLLHEPIHFVVTFLQLNIDETDDAQWNTEPITQQNSQQITSQNTQ